MGAPSSNRGARTLAQLAWPLVMSGQIGVLTGLVIAFWVGRFLGEDGLAGLALVRPVMLCVFWLFGSVAFGATFLVARSVGARDGRGLAILTSGIGLLVLAWLAALLAVLPNAGAISGTLGAGASASVADYVVPWVLVTLPAATLCELIMSVGAAAGQTRLTLIRSLVDLALVASVTPALLAATEAGLGAGPLAHALASAIVGAALWRTLVRRGR
ncbi:MAG TPA: MATE family efflux transporter, partial [Kofleriaceae bacterium]|nr:MATE family efflux transporter [Kofleriaceae bacterium]